MTATQQAVMTVTREDQARALSQNVAFLGRFVTPRSPSKVAPELGMASNLAHHHARKLADLGLLFEQRRAGGRVYYQLAAREFRHAHDLLPPGDPDENVVAGLRVLSAQFLAAHTRSWHLAEGEGDDGQMVYGFLEPTDVPAPHPSSTPVEPHPAHFDAVTLRLTPERYRRLALDLSRLLNDAMTEVMTVGQTAPGTLCTLAVLAYRGELRGYGKEVSRSTSSFLGLEPAPDGPVPA